VERSANVIRNKRIFISLEPIDEEFNPALPAGVDYPYLASRAVSISLHAPRALIRDIRARARRAPREAISSIYRQRLHGSFAEAPLPPPLVPRPAGARRAEHFTYAAGWPRERAAISGGKHCAVAGPLPLRC